VGMHTIAYNFEESSVADAYIEQFCDLLTIPLLAENT